MTVADALKQAYCLRATSSSWRLDGELLLADALGRRREHLYAYPEQSLSQDSLGRYQDSIQRRLNGEPLAYILGRKAFWDFELKVNKEVLIPRPETEVLVETALQVTVAYTDTPLQVADLGTGSGAIAIALARTRPAWRIHAVDVNAEALGVARDNARQLAPGCIEFHHGSWCEALPAIGFDIIVSNPPYVARKDKHLDEDGLPFEPAQALVAGSDGLTAIRRIIDQSPSLLNSEGWLMLEHGFDQGPVVRALFAQAGFEKVAGFRDYGGHERVTAGRLG